MSPSVPQNSHLALLAVVSALLILKAVKRAPEKPSLLKDIRSATSQVDAGEPLFDSEYDIIIVGGGELTFISGNPRPLNAPLQEPQAVCSLLAFPRIPTFRSC